MSSKQKTKKYKIKTHKATAKRFRISGSGAILRTKGPKSHLRRKKSARSKNEFAKMVEVSTPGFKRHVKRLAPYLKRHNPNPPG